MDGISIYRTNDSPKGNGVTSLLTRQGDLEIMTQKISGESVVWLSPATDANALEFFFVHSGRFELAMDDGVATLGAGDSFVVSGLTHNVPARALGGAEILYVTNCPSFENVQHFEETLRMLLEQIDENDHYTRNHSANVLRYSMALYEEMHLNLGDTFLDDLVVASLFHDVGKCFVPGEILRKTGELTREEIRILLRHPLDSGRMLRGEFGENVAEIAMNHHERLDGSGYPRGLIGSDISLAAQIVAVADVYDAMTSNRGYNRVKSQREAIDELLRLDTQFNVEIVRALERYVLLNYSSRKEIQA